MFKNSSLVTVIGVYVDKKQNVCVYIKNSTDAFCLLYLSAN